jgi:hypothetical protein
MEDLAEQLPTMIAEAAKSPLGLFALMVISLSILGFFFFREASEKTRVAIFVMLFLGVAAFGISIVQTDANTKSMAEPGAVAGTDEKPVDDAPEISIDGTWAAKVTYGWGPTYQESFVFNRDRDLLIGTASFLGRGRGIVDARIEGNRISFEIPWTEVIGDETRKVRNSYVGNVQPDRIDFHMQDDRGNPPIRFEATRAHQN